MTVHRETLKKKQKGFKSRHATKGSIRTANKGRIDKGGATGPKHNVRTKQDRKNIAKQIQANKRETIAEKLKIFETKNGVPRNVAFVPLTPDIDRSKVLSQFTSSLEAQADPEIPNVIYVPRFRQRLRLFLPDYPDFFGVLDACKGADFVVFVLSAETENNDYGESLIRCVLSQGVTTCLAMIYALENIEGVKQQAQVRSSLSQWYAHFFPEAEKLQRLDTNEALTTARIICQKTPKGVNWRNERPYVVIEKLEQNPTNGALAIQGYVRGRTLNPDTLMHIQGFGDLKIENITEVLSGRQMDVDPRTWTPSENSESCAPLGDTAIELNDYEEDDETTANAGVRMDGHYYVNEMIEAEGGEGPQSLSRVPEGVSDYQAAWFLEGEDYHFDEDEMPGDENMLEDEEGELVGETQNGADERMMEDEELDEDEESRQLKQFRERATDDLEFPDEIELKPEENARERLKRYRGVRSLRQCQWDANENDPRAPEEFTRLCRPGNLQNTMNHLAKEEFKGPEVGTSVIITFLPFTEPADTKLVANYQEKLANEGMMLAAYGLLRSENKVGMMNMSLTTDSEFSTPLKSKEQIICQYGPRRLLVEPLYSQPGRGSDNNVYKFYRYLQPGSQATVSMMAPVMLGSSPVIYFANETEPKLIGTGTTMDADASRIIVKTAILTGHPLKIHKKLVTVRYMFFNPEDVAWFKAVPLFTKWGCTGYIKESLGTHGYFKATFDKRIKAQDTISMALHKRVWPRLALPWSPPNK
ncbi:Ribosome biogenesis protein TSR1 [Wickerhamiella sorbophila]|uniref:Ribosome biogenesis protein TSR1 n=1 Tax=Wickerhamiella sorbophila TaxID=45607 RepID=A0A2T0FGT5_9ASCO|nr:Ribosome biogenesis protein TSR1 [Wickerhamiella sorbophila]XP_024664140.1 Ribosome biogenesis protein TSR1 [Wickerhamiella sorbophila]PRT53347.1 Ribosome biogenesis protein TSR1 [Wickerhamiella sorbophila]PRT54195.1 Ribosome biogenesis protein TSR1 [Wickerhamiella sorbophila]